MARLSPKLGASLRTLLALLVGISCSFGIAAAQGPPNIVVLVADDMGFGDASSFGSTTIATPRIDQIGQEGVRCTSFYAHSVCTPTRAALMTGRYAPRVGMTQAIGSWSPLGLDPAETTIAEVLGGAGYRTALFGKWHLGDSPDQVPTAQGFDEFQGLLWGPTGLPLLFINSMAGTQEWEPDQRFDTQRATTAALDFIDRAHAAAEPFFCYVAYTTPHEPASASPAFQGQSADGRDYGDAVEEMDASIGTLVDRIDALGIGDETLVVFFSDNGASTGGDPYQNGSNAPLRGGKGSSWEGGVRVPAAMRFPGVIPPGQVLDAPLVVTDLLPTAAGLAGAALDPQIALDGVDIMGALQGGPLDVTRVVHISNGANFEAVRRGRFKYRNGALYDVASDPGETVDLAGLLPGVRSALALELSDIQADVAANRREAAMTQRIEQRWRGGLGHSLALHDGALWTASTADRGTLQLVDNDPLVDLETVNIGSIGTFTLPDVAMRVEPASAEVGWRGTGVGYDALGPFSIVFWYRAPTAPGEALTLLDIGDGSAGLSVTLGDAGAIGDDPGPGEADDLLIRIGGSASTVSGTVAVDLPAKATSEFINVAITREDLGDLVVSLNGFEAARVHVPGANWNPAGSWAIFAPDGEIGGAGGDGVLPFAATRSRGEIAGFGAWNRRLRPNELENQYCRYFAVTYCHGRMNSTGQDAHLRFSGSFNPADEELMVHVERAPVASVGFLVAGRAQGRESVAAGTLCLADPWLRLSKQIVSFDAAGSTAFNLDWQMAPASLDTSSFPAWNFQCWYRDGGTSNFTNAVLILFCQ